MCTVRELSRLIIFIEIGLSLMAGDRAVKSANVSILIDHNVGNMKKCTERRTRNIVHESYRNRRAKIKSIINGSDKNTYKPNAVALSIENIR